MTTEKLSSVAHKNINMSRRSLMIFVGSYLISLLLWMPAWINVAFLWFGYSSSRPSIWMLLVSLSIYPIIVIPSIICGSIAYTFRHDRISIFSFLFPLGMTVIAIIVIGASDISYQIAERKRINAFWDAPPMKISDLNLEASNDDELFEDATFFNVFILPESVTETAVEEWDGKTLTYHTGESSDEIRKFYSDAYQILGFHVRSSGGGKGYQSIDYEISEVNFLALNNAYFTVRISNDDSQPSTQVRIATCFDISDCWEAERQDWE